MKKCEYCVQTNFMQFARTVQGDSTVLSPLSAESWQPLSVLRVQARGSQPTNQPSLPPSHGLQPKAPWPSTHGRVQCWVAMRRYFSHSRLSRLDSPFEKNIQHQQLASQHKLLESQQQSKKSGIILHSTHFTLFLFLSFLPPYLPIAQLELDPHDLTPCHAIDFIRRRAVWWTFIHLILYSFFNNSLLKSLSSAPNDLQQSKHEREASAGLFENLPLLMVIRYPLFVTILV